MYSSQTNDRRAKAAKQIAIAVVLFNLRQIQARPCEWRDFQFKAQCRAIEPNVPALIGFNNRTSVATLNLQRLLCVLTHFLVLLCVDVDFSVLG